MKQPTRSELLTKIKDLESQLAHTYSAANRELLTLTQDKYFASGLVVTVHALGGRQVLRPVCIRDGFSPATIQALQADLRRSFEGATKGGSF